MIVSGAITRSIADIFKNQISARLAKLLSASPSTVIILVPSIRDIVSHHVALPQAAFEKESFGLPKVCHSPYSLFSGSSVDVAQNPDLFGRFWVLGTRRLFHSFSDGVVLDLGLLM
jgi:hypothetical protein